MSEELKVRIRPEGGEKTRREVKRTRDEIKGMGKDGTGAMEGMVGAASAAMAAIGGVAAITGVARQAFALFQQDMQRSQQTFVQNQADMTDLLFMGDRVKDPNFRARVNTMAVAARRDPKEMAKGLYTLESMTGGMDKTNRAALAAEMSQHARVSSTDMGALGALYGKIGSLPGLEKFNANMVQNISTEFMNQAGITDPRMAAQLLPRALAVGPKSGLGQRQMGGLLASATQYVGSPEMAATGLEVMARNLMGAKGGKLGLRGNLLERMEQVGGMGLGTAQQDELLGESGSRLALMLSEMPKVRGQVSGFVSRTAPENDILMGKSTTAMRLQPGHVAADILKKYKVRGTIADEEMGDREYEIARGYLEATGKERGHSGWARRQAKNRAWLGQVMGLPAEYAGIDFLGSPASVLTEYERRGELRTDLGELRSAATDAARESEKIKTGF